jgi:protein TonB
MQGQRNPIISNAVPTWKTQIVALLERNKRYPETSQSRREQGVAQVFFSIDRQGRVIDSRVVRSSGASALDEEALALLRPEAAGRIGGRARRSDRTDPLQSQVKPADPKR